MTSISKKHVHFADSPSNSFESVNSSKTYLGRTFDYLEEKCSSIKNKISRIFNKCMKSTEDSYIATGEDKKHKFTRLMLISLIVVQIALIGTILICLL